MQQTVNEVRQLAIFKIVKTIPWGLLGNETLIVWNKKKKKTHYWVRCENIVDSRNDTRLFLEIPNTFENEDHTRNATRLLPEIPTIFENEDTTRNTTCLLPETSNNLWWGNEKATQLHKQDKH